MEMRQITNRYTVSPQIGPEDISAIAKAGFVKIICNRPDDEVDIDISENAIREAAESHGLDFVSLPFTMANLTEDLIEKHMGALDDSAGPVLAYCRTGTRCCCIWALGMAGQAPLEDILSLTYKAGYDLAHLATAIEARINKG